MYYNNNTYSDDSEPITEVVFINRKTKEIEFTITYSYNYPFSVPTVTISDHIIAKTIQSDKPYIAKNYHSWSQSLLKHRKKKQLDNNNIQLGWLLTKNYYKSMPNKWERLPTNNDCLGCLSILCSNNWAPSLSMYNIAAEYLLRKRFMIYTSDKNLNYIWRIINRIFSKYKNNNITIPDEVIFHILTYGIPNFGF
jgi:hypothetical protein